jgi:dienelactone hydrolase
MRFVFALLGLCCSAAFGQEKLLWGNLQPGPYAVGFQSRYELDATRDYDPAYPVQPGAARSKKPRPIFIAWWYPAQSSAAPRLVYRDYLDAHEPGAEAAEFARRLAAYNRDVTCAEIAGKDVEDELADDDQAACDAFLSTPTYAVRDARPASGRFPVVVYHAGLSGSYEDNAVLCEFLASQGYVVLATAYANADSTLAAISWDLSTTFADTAFVMRFAATLPFADASRLAAVGHSFGAQASLAWHAEPNSPLDAVAALDTTVEYGTLDWPGFAPLKLQLTQGRNGTAPVLLFASRGGNPRFDTFDTYLRFAPRYEATVDFLEHHDYISHGAIGKTLRLDRARGEAVRRSYDRVCVHLWKFLDAYVKHDGEALAWLEHGARDASQDDTFQLRFKPARPAPPTGRQIVSLLDTLGAARTRELLAQVEGDMDPGTMMVAGKTLADARRLRDAVTVFTWATEIFPHSVQVHQALGDALKNERAAARAKEVYAKALLLVDSDPDLSDPERVDARGEIQEALDTLEREQ